MNSTPEQVDPRLLTKPAQSQMPRVTVTRIRGLFNMHKSELFLSYCCMAAQPHLSGGPKISVAHARNDNKKWKGHMEPLLPASHCSRWQLGQETYWKGLHALGYWKSNANPGCDSWQNLNYFYLNVTLLSCIIFIKLIRLYQGYNEFCSGNRTWFYHNW